MKYCIFVPTRTTLARETWRYLFEFIIATAGDRNRVLGEHGLSPNDSRTLFALDAKQGRAMSALAEAWGTDASYVTAAVDRLERRRLARRTNAPGDRRVKLVVLTPAGVRMKARLAARLFEPPAQLRALPLADLHALWTAAAHLRHDKA